MKHYDNELDQLIAKSLSSSKDKMVIPENFTKRVISKIATKHSYKKLFVSWIQIVGIYVVTAVALTTLVNFLFPKSVDNIIEWHLSHWNLCLISIIFIVYISHMNQVVINYLFKRYSIKLKD
ncbi:hypothetical protein K4L44_17165 [Halosquirtibacter laminarini]|uniref:Uncharacterized protein n=1 Tax=Halosquirtibacter laminarini TaxID=3374600 RepID=A0AC61NF30_9BACT|nr:hypothetical protein K4L44_17165 [Prolixibacteraceae bacterium]